MPVYTTNQVAELLDVCRNTVCALFDNGKLGGHRNGPLNERCIRQGDLIAFLEKHKMPFVFRDNKIYTDKNCYTTTQAAKISGLSANTIIKLFDSGKIKGFRIPGSRFRRIFKLPFIDFLEENNIPFVL